MLSVTGGKGLNMLYVIRNRDTGEVFETESFKRCFRVAIGSALGDFRYPVYLPDGRNTMLLQVSRCDDCAYWMDEQGYLHSVYVNEEHVAYVAVSSIGYAVDMADGRYYEVNRGCC